MLTGILRRGDELYLYYKTSDSTHGGVDRSGKDPATTPQERRTPWTTLRRAVVPLHRFVSATSGWDGGFLTTPPLSFSGSRLELNLNTSAMGAAWVGILKENGHPVKGFSHEECDPINGNFLRHVVSWKGQDDLSALSGKPIRLRFQSRATDLYAFRFLD